MPLIKKEAIAIVGGTGKEGKGLAYRWAKAGHEIFIGSRNLEKAQTAATEINQLLHDNERPVLGLINFEAVRKANIVVITVPYQAHREILMNLKEDLKSKIAVDVTVPLVPPHVTRVQIPKEGSTAVEAQKILGPEVYVVSAFQNISYDLLLKNQSVDCDVLISSNNPDARQQVINLAEDAGLTGWDAGPLENSIVAEGLTSILIGINKKYGSKSAGIKITGVKRRD